MVRFAPIFVATTLAAVVALQACMANRSVREATAQKQTSSDSDPSMEETDAVDQAFVALDRGAAMRFHPAPPTEEEKPRKNAKAVAEAKNEPRVGATLAAKGRSQEKTARVPSAASVRSSYDGRRLPGEPKVPPRPANAPGGSAILQSIALMNVQDRERILLREMQRGNIPSFLRKLVPVRMDGQGGSATVFVMPDYLAVGSDSDYVRVPLSRYAAARIAREWGFVLPTTRIVDAIYSQAEVQARPAPLPAGEGMVTVPYLLRHEKMLQNSLGHHYRAGQLVAGLKKDLVLSNKLVRHPNRVAIYGWHQLDAQPIQPLSDVHDAYYSDYSHGVRLVGAIVAVDGKRRSIYDVLSDPTQASILSDEGRLVDASRQMRQLPAGALVSHVREVH